MPLPNRSLATRPSDGVVRQRLTPLGAVAVSPGTPHAPHGPAAAPPPDGPLVDVAQLRTLLGFPLRAVVRHRRLCAWLAAAVVTTAVLAALFMPRTYHVESRILAQKNVVMPALGNPKRAVPMESDAPTRLAAEAVMSRENLIEIVRETNLLAQENVIRSPLGRVKQAVLGRARARTEAERVDAILEVLRKRMWVAADEAGEGTVTIGIDWPDPRTGLAIATTAQERFLEGRHTTEVARIGESIVILERYVEGARAAIDSAVDAVASVPRRPGAAPVPPAVGGLTRSARAANPVVAGLQSTLATRRAEIEDLVASRASRLDAARKQLADLQRDYGAAHPEVQAAQQAVAALAAESPQLVSLRAEVQTLRDRLTALRAPEAPVAPASTADAALARAALDRLMRPRGDSLDDPRITYAQSRLKIAITDYEDLLTRLESARIELETARAAFKYRYRVVSPPQLPKRAVSPNVPVLLGMGAVLAVALAMFAATALDLAGGRLLEAWQVERQLGLPLLADVERR